jgi:ferric-dicitrate binding protein FerR (iron transport regulator)
MKYVHYTVEDFVMDSYFQEWVQHPTKETNIFWERWLIDNPSKAETIAEARAIVQSIQFDSKPMPADKAEQIWNVLEKAIANETSVVKFPKQVDTISKKAARGNFYYQKIAAGLAGIILLAAAFFLLRDWAGTTQYKTVYGETRKIQLPDGSLVMLNSNSKLSFDNNFLKSEIREVWLDGEAFFSVVHTSNHQRFIVHTDDFLQVEVLGTEFNVTKRKNKTRVVLETGKIKLNIQSATNKEATKQSLLMNPGELVEFDEASDRYIKKEVNPQIYSSWKSNKLLLDDTSLQEIVQLLENTYGFQVKVTNHGLLKQKVSGSIPLSNQDTLLQYIAQTFEVRINRTGNSITIQQIHMKK